MKDTYNSAMRFPGKSYGTQTMEERHRTFLKLVIKGKLCEAVRFACKREKGGFLQPEKLAADHMGTINNTVVSSL